MAELKKENIVRLLNRLEQGEIAALVGEVKSSFSALKALKAKIDEKSRSFAAFEEEPSVPYEPAPDVAQEPSTEADVLPDETKSDEPVKKAEEPKAEAVKETPKKPAEPERPSWIVSRAKDQPAPQRATYVPKQEYKPWTDRSGDRQPRGARPQGGAGRPFDKPKPFTAPAVPVYGKDSKNFNQKKKTQNERSFEEKKTLNKRALIKNNVSVDDFDEDKSGYRKLRVKKSKEKVESAAIKIEKAVLTSDVIPLKTLSEKIGISAIEITKRLFKEGIMKTINDSVDFDTAAYIASDLGIELELKMEKTAEELLTETFEGVENAEGENLVKRPPVVTVMGHVDHGKTSLLDRIRKTNVTSGEAGGITQHIGAYQVVANGKPITFLDTPGHEAFTAMRMRGAQVTDIAVIVIAADDGIMPQTIEAIHHAKAAGVSIIVAVNKIDKPEANIERIKTQLTEHEILIEEWGGDVMLCPVSAKTGKGVDELLESILLLADVKDLKANPDRKAKGTVVEAKLDAGKGPIATVLVQNGTLKVGDSIVVGMVTGKVRAMSDDKGRRISSAGPSVPVSIMGLDDVPNAGDTLFAVEEGKLTKQVAEERKNREKEERQKSAEKVSLDDLFSKIEDGQVKTLNLIVKADVRGSAEAVKSSFEKLSNDEVKVRVIHAGVGAISESDVMLADSSNAVIIGFNVRPDTKAKQLAEQSKVDVKLYRVIYEAIEDIQAAMKGMLAPKITETYMGKAEVRQTFRITGVGMVAGSYVVDGKIIRNGKLRIYRDNVMICEGNVLQLKRFKDDVKEVQQGFECGISIENFNDINVGDFIESYLIEEVKPQ